MSTRPASLPKGDPRSVASPAPPASVGLALVGSGGDGIVLLGNLMLGLAARHGLYGMQVLSYGPQIRGGESAAVLRLSSAPVQYEGDEVDALVCFRVSDLRRFAGQLRMHAKARLVLDTADTTPLPEGLGHAGADAFRYPFVRYENGVEVPGEPRNMLAFGLLCRAFGFDPARARALLEEKFAHRPESLARNRAAFDHAFAEVSIEPLPGAPALLASCRERPLVIETGNEATARASIEAGLGFYAGYPITPSSEIMETVLDELPPERGTVVQAEDEIAALGMVIGASFGGVTAMTATSGPGLSLMTEMMGLASMTELPVVIVDCQRAGPATGMPSRMEQGDLFHALFAGHGDFPRVVMAAFDVVHARTTMHRAFHLAESYQLPVLVLSDAYIAQRTEIHDPLPPPPVRPRRLVWKPGDAPARFDVTDPRGIGAFRVPGTPAGTYMAAGIEHLADGRPTSDGAVHQRMNEKRFAKMAQIASETRDWFTTMGDPTAPFGVVAWGSTAGVLREWIACHPAYRAFLPEIIEPFPLASFEEWRRGLSELTIVEVSYQGQLFRALSGLTSLTGAKSAARSGGLPLTLAELSRMLGEDAR
jgi:2-oxoglutarate ferredoxin oxidoreductase subunit alpha